MVMVFTGNTNDHRVELSGLEHRTIVIYIE